MHDIVEAERGEQHGQRRTAKDTVEATPEQIASAPRGDLIHRTWNCKHTEPLRQKGAPAVDTRTARNVDVSGHLAWEKGLLARPTIPRKKRSKVETFNWHTLPKDGLAAGNVYPDGSARDGPIPELERLGWSFAVVDGNGKVAAAAYGVPPPWITDIGGAEAWALYQALLHTIPEQCNY